MRVFYDPVSIIAIATIGSQLVGGIAAGNEEKRAANDEAAFLDTQARDEELASNRAQRDERKDARRLLARQRASLAASGIGLEDGSLLLEETRGESSLRINRIRNDSSARASGLRKRGSNTRKAARKAPLIGALRGGAAAGSTFISARRGGII